MIYNRSMHFCCFSRWENTSVLNFLFVFLALFEPQGVISKEICKIINSLRKIYQIKAALIEKIAFSDQLICFGDQWRRSSKFWSSNFLSPLWMTLKILVAVITKFIYTKPMIFTMWPDLPDWKCLFFIIWLNWKER